jgi:hypothetical protein
MPGTLADLSVAGRLALRATARRLGRKQVAAPDTEGFRDTLQRRLEAAPAGVVKQGVWVDMSADQPPWLDSGVTVEPGDHVSYFMAGRLVLNKLLDLHFPPDLQVWCRVGEEGEVFRGTRCSHSFVASTPGQLCFGNYFPSAWKSRQGELATDKTAYAANQGSFRILVIVWRSSADDGIRALLNSGEEPLLASELERLEQGETTPEGWHYLWHVGPAEIFRSGHAEAGGQDCIHCRTHKDVGILQHEVNIPLTPGSELSWRWCVSRLPSTLREDTVPSHDYLSIAVEFDNGRDITYYWSASLPEGYGYDCPLPNWSGIEYHVVVRSGSEGLGEWLDERRNLYEDYRHYMGEPPAQITRVWFIAVSIFQRGEGVCDYADICLHDDESMIRLL